MIAFTHVWAFSLLPLPVLVWFFVPPVSARQSLRVPASVAGFLHAAAGQGAERHSGGITSWLTISVGWAALIVALAGPYSRAEALMTPTGRDLVLAIDFSASMAVEDMGTADTPLPRIDVARDLVGSFLAAREGDRLGLIAFASEAFVIAPLTFDGRAVSSMLNELAIGLPGRKTDIGRAIGMTVHMFKDLPTGERVLVILSDGETNAGGLTALDAARLAKDHGIVIHMIGFAQTIEPENEAHMREIAAATGGLYLEATSPDALDVTLRRISDSAPISVDADDPHAKRDLRTYPMILALVAALIAGWGEHRRR